MRRFNPLWINTALKLNVLDKQYKPSFNPLWINTALKLKVATGSAICSFNPLWINTALKREDARLAFKRRFNPLWINTALKHNLENAVGRLVSIPYGLTLLSNLVSPCATSYWFQSPMD